jgi:hypothetical protein
MRSMRTLVGAAAALCLMGSVSLAEKIANPEYELWSKFKAGAMSKVEGKTVAAGQESKQTITTKLLEITPEKAVVEVTMEMEVAGQKMPMPAQKRDVPAKIDNAAIQNPAEAPNAPKPEMKESEETVTVAGKTLKCKVVETTSEQNGMKVVAKAWTSAEVPGQLVKTETKTTGPVESTTTMSLVEFSAGS